MLNCKTEEEDPDAKAHHAADYPLHMAMENDLQFASLQNSRTGDGNPIKVAYAQGMRQIGRKEQDARMMNRRQQQFRVIFDCIIKVLPVTPGVVPVRIGSAHGR